MNSNTKFVLMVLFALLSISTISAQSIQSLRLKRTYVYNDLDKIVDAIGLDLNIRFVYDKEHLSRYQTSFDPFMNAKESSVGGILRTLRDAWDMETSIGKNGYVYIARDKEHMKQLQSSHITQVEQQVEEVQTARSAMTPIKTNYTLTGDVFDIDTGERIPYATVAVSATPLGTATDANGHFTINNIPADTCTLQVRYIGYRTKWVSLSPTEENAPVRIDMEAQSQDIATVFIIGRKDDKALQQYTGEHKMKMAPEALKLLPNIGEKDILRGFQLMPGVSASNESSSGMYVRGGTPDQNLILYDGFTVYYVDHLHGFYSAFNSNAIKDVQLYKGGFDAKYGGRLSSVTEITAKDGNKNRFTLGGEVSLLSVNAYTEIPIGSKVTTLFAFRRSYQGYMWNKVSGQNKVFEGQTAVEKPAMRGSSSSSSPAYFYDLNGKITITPTSKDIVSLSIFNGTDYIDNTPSFSFGGGKGGFGGIQMDNADYAKYGNLGISARWIRKLNDKWSMNLLTSYSNFYAKRDQRRSIIVTRTNDDGETETEEINSGSLEENQLYDYSLKNDWRYQLNEYHSLEFGVYATKYDIKYTYTQNEEETLLDKRNDAVLAGVYLQDRLNLIDGRFIVTPGVRLNYFSSTSQLYLEPRLSGSYRLTSKLTANAATGLFYQFANRIVREDVMAGNTDFWILSDGDEIPVSRSAHFNLGLNYDLPDFIFGVEAYYKRNHNISEYTLRYKQNKVPMGGSGGSESNTEISENFYVGDGYAMGIEFLAQKKAGKFNGWVSYSIGQVKNRFPDQSETYYYASQDVTHELKMVGIYRFGNFDVSATWIYATGRPYTAPLGAYQINSVSGVTESYYAVSDKNTFRLPAYHRLDFSASYRFNIFGTKGRQNALSFSLFNAYNRNNVSAKQFQIVDDTILESNINYLSITPNVSLIFKF